MRLVYQLSKGEIIRMLALTSVVGVKCQLPPRDSQTRTLQLYLFKQFDNRAQYLHAGVKNLFDYQFK